MGLFNNMKDAKRAMWLYEGYRCSACGEENLAKQKIILQYRYDEIGLSRSENERKAAAEKKLDEAQEMLTARAEDSGDVGKYYDLNLLGKCRKCGHREPWSRMRSRWCNTVFNTLLAMSVLATIVGVAELFMGVGALVILPAVVLIGVTVAMKLVQRSLRKSRERKIAALNSENIPFLTAEEEVFRQRFPDADTEKLEKIEPSAYYQVIDT